MLPQEPLSLPGILSKAPRTSTGLDFSCMATHWQQRRDSRAPAHGDAAAMDGAIVHAGETGRLHWPSAVACFDARRWPMRCLSFTACHVTSLDSSTAGPPPSPLLYHPLICPSYHPPAPGGRKIPRASEGLSRDNVGQWGTVTWPPTARQTTPYSCASLLSLPPFPGYLPCRSNGQRPRGFDVHSSGLLVPHRGLPMALSPVRYPARRYLRLYELRVREFIQVPVSSWQAGGGTSRHPLAHRLQLRHCRGGMFLSSRLLIENRFRSQRCRLAG
ncbi:uncharacterized protein BDZ83DRAFT_628987 [Colletotrichum acutatum]|uniref:Uncharacterized protein n=1 Tax=Glomerella acutata TaxID=27357 RepID=A0AAD8UL21_GLOAC|nr:uncharacterized protein BDZ83DRAFT_628987 [Colletotrichum acutatum]KAK1722440.1 hypothetical protein BDZ83DRAFT_628987 [Colletotrichum acutatum]